MDKIAVEQNPSVTYFSFFYPQLKFVRENSFRSSSRLLFDCVHLLTALVRSLRYELGLPCYSLLDQNESLSAAGDLAELTLLCPERLAGTVETAGFPSRWISTVPARRRLASTLRLAMTPFQKAFTLLSKLSTDRTTSTRDEQQRSSQVSESVILFFSCS